MIFSTRWLEEKEGSIFQGAPISIEQHIINEKCCIILKYINPDNVLETFHAVDDPQKLSEIVEILQKEDSDYEFDSIEDLGYLKIQISDFFQDHHLTEGCITSLSQHMLDKENGGYFQKEYVSTEGDEKIIYRAIGIGHLPTAPSDEDKMQWSHILSETFSFGNKEDEEIYLCLHTKTDYIGEGNGYNARASQERSKIENKNISVFLFHHDPEIYPVAKAILMKGECLKKVWDKLNKIKHEIH